jgi:hypothetical protein
MRANSLRWLPAIPSAAETPTLRWTVKAVQPSVPQPVRGLWPIIAGKLAGTISTENSYDEHAQYRGATINPNKRNCFRDGSERHWTTVTPAPRGCAPIDLTQPAQPRFSPRGEAAASALIPRICSFSTGRLARRQWLAADSRLHDRLFNGGTDGITSSFSVRHLPSASNS